MGLRIKSDPGCGGRVRDIHYEDLALFDVEIPVIV